MERRLAAEPKIIGFLCNWCAYSGADIAGSSRQSYPPNVRVIRVMCSGRVDPTFVMKAFASGADGVLILGCHPGDCHYISGNAKALGRIELLGRLLGAMGLEAERLRIDWVSAAQGERFAAIVREMTETLRALGPRDPARLALPATASHEASP